MCGASGYLEQQGDHFVVHLKLIKKNAEYKL